MKKCVQGNLLHKVRLYMKYTSLILIVICSTVISVLASEVKAQNILEKRVTISFNDVSLVTALNQISKQIGVDFTYNSSVLNTDQKFSVAVKNVPLKKLLDQLFVNRPFSYTAIDDEIAVKYQPQKQEKQVLKKKSVETPGPIKVTGKIVDDQDLPLPGVNIHVAGTERRAVSRSDGTFEIEVADKGAILVISYVGFKTQQIVVDDQTSIIVKLIPYQSTLDAVRIIAYGTTTQRLSTSSIGTVSADVIEKQPVSNPLAALEGRVPGMVVTQNSGLPGSNFNVQIRGRTSIENTSDPLYLIDGVPYNANSLDELNGAYGVNPGSGITGQSPFASISPNDIESITILKDAAATSIYGSRGANGVILITTKKGKAGKTQVTGNFNEGAGVVTRTMDYLNTSQYLQMRNEAFKNDGVAPTTATAPDLMVWDTTRNTNWKKLLLGGTAVITNASASITGGSDQTQFLVGANYHHETTVFPGDLADDRANVHFNLTHTSTDQKFYLLLSAIYDNDRNSLVSNDLTAFINTPPDAPVPYTANGKLNWSEGGAYFNNPLGYTQQPYSAITGNLVSNAVIRYTIIPGLDVKTNLGYTNTNLQQSELLPASSQDPISNPVSTARFGNNTSKTWIIEPQATYTFRLDKGVFNTLLGATWQQDLISGTRIMASNFSSDLLLNSPAAAGSITAATNYDQYRYESVFGRINYNYDDKYIVELTGRRDGSSRFGPDKEFANFGAISGAWIFTQEKFVKDNLSFLSFGKIRGSYGITGNDKIGNYNFLDTYISTSSPYQGTSGLRPSALSNPDYAWEINRKLEAALDLGFLKDRILVSADYFRNRSSNELVNYTLPEQTGFTSILENFPAVIQNSGFEFSLNTVNVKNKTLQWTTSFNISFDRSKLVSYPGLATSSYAQSYVIGYPLDIRKLLVSQGVNPQTGIYQFNGTDIPADQTSINNLDPKFYGGLDNSISYKGFQLDFFFQFVKQNGLNYFAGANSAGNAPGTMYNQPNFVLSRWQNPGDQTNIQKFSQQATASNNAQLAYYYYVYYSNAIVSDASYIRLKNLSLSYDIPATWIKSIKAKKLRVYLQGQNLLTITSYKGNDPETGSVSGDYLPPLRVVTAGFQLTY